VSIERSRIPLSVIVLTKNEEKGLADTLSRLQDFDQVVVVDSDSTDSTVEIARGLGAEVINFAWDGNYPKKKQWSLENVNARNKWILLLDADEYPSPELIDELRAIAPSLGRSAHSAFDINLSYRFAGKFLSHGHTVTKRSLLDPIRSRFPVVDDLEAPGIREVEGHYQPEADGSIGSLHNRLMHDDKDPVRSWFDRHNRYSDWEAHLRINSSARRDIASKRTKKGAIFDRVPFKPVAFFTYSYIARLGFLDGRAGLDYALALSMYYWQIDVKTREIQAIRNSDPSISPLPRADNV
jgi:glycosyltransferase involved in cell wall biosynthesis